MPVLVSKICVEREFKTLMNLNIAYCSLLLNSTEEAESTAHRDAFAVFKAKETTNKRVKMKDDSDQQKSVITYPIS